MFAFIGSTAKAKPKAMPPKRKSAHKKSMIEREVSDRVELALLQRDAKKAFAVKEQMPDADAAAGSASDPVPDLTAIEFDESDRLEAREDYKRRFAHSML